MQPTFKLRSRLKVVQIERNTKSQQEKVTKVYLFSIRHPIPVQEICGRLIGGMLGFAYGVLKSQV